MCGVHILLVPAVVRGWWDRAVKSWCGVIAKGDVLTKVATALQQETSQDDGDAGICGKATAAACDDAGVDESAFCPKALCACPPWGIL